jgi:hypothetical protein
MWWEKLLWCSSLLCLEVTSFTSFQVITHCYFLKIFFQHFAVVVNMGKKPWLLTDIPQDLLYLNFKSFFSVGLLLSIIDIALQEN